MMLLTGQPLLQNGVPQSMHRALWPLACLSSNPMQNLFEFFKRRGPGFLPTLFRSNSMDPVIFPIMGFLYLGSSNVCFALAWAWVLVFLAAWISPNARLYSLGNTLTNLARAELQLSSKSRALFEPVQRWWSSSNFVNWASAAWSRCQTGLGTAVSCSAAVKTFSRETISVLQSLWHYPFSAYT